MYVYLHSSAYPAAIVGVLADSGHVSDETFIHVRYYIYICRSNSYFNPIVTCCKSTTGIVVLSTFRLEAAAGVRREVTAVRAVRSACNIMRKKTTETCRADRIYTAYLISSNVEILLLLLLLYLVVVELVVFLVVLGFARLENLQHPVVKQW